MRLFLKLILFVFLIFSYLEGAAKDRQSRQGRRGGWNSLETPKTQDRRTRGRRGGWNSQSKTPVVEREANWDRLERRRLQAFFRGLEHSHRQVENLTDIFAVQLLNQDIISTAQMGLRLDARLEEVDFYVSALQLEAMLLGLESDQLVDHVFKNSKDRERFRKVDLAMPSLPREIAVRLPLFYNNAGQGFGLEIDDRNSYNSGNEMPINFQDPVDFFSYVGLMNINFTTLTKASDQSWHRAGYPREDAASDYHLRCTTGAFFSRSQKPRLASAYENFYPDRPPGQRKHESLMSDFKDWKSLECRAPQSVDLYLNGKRMSFSCDPGGIADQNVKRAVQGSQLCDPLIYGFIPFQLENPSRAQGVCHTPDPFIIGRNFSAKSSNIYGRVNHEEVTMYMASLCPSCLKTELESYCDNLARNVVAPLVTLPKGLGGMDGSIWLAAKLAAENPRLWQRKLKRFDSHCKGIPRKFTEFDNCQTIHNRIEAIKKAIDLLEHFVPMEPVPDIHMVGEEKRSAG